jgi:hypothetical protein
MFPIFEVSPGAVLANDLGLVEPDDRLGQGVVVGISHASHRRLDAGLGQALRVADRQVLHASVTVVHELVDIGKRLAKSVSRAG